MIHTALHRKVGVTCKQWGSSIMFDSYEAGILLLCSPRNKGYQHISIHVALEIVHNAIPGSITPCKCNIGSSALLSCYTITLNQYCNGSLWWFFFFPFSQNVLNDKGQSRNIFWGSRVLMFLGFLMFVLVGYPLFILNDMKTPLNSLQVRLCPYVKKNNLARHRAITTTQKCTTYFKTLNVLFTRSSHPKWLWNGHVAKTYFACLKMRDTLKSIMAKYAWGLTMAM